MRKLRIFIYLLLGLLILTPYVTGYIFKRQFLLFITELNKNPQSLIKITLLDYKEGWLSSDASIQVKPKAHPSAHEHPDATSPDIVATFHNHISHGPILKNPLTRKLDFALAKITSNIYLEGIHYTTSSSDHSILRLRTLVDSNGNWESRIDKFPRFIVFDNIQFNLQNEKAMGILKLHTQNGITNRLYARLYLGTLTVAPLNDTLHQEFSFSNLRYELQENKKASGLWVGYSAIHIPTFTATKEGKPIVTIQSSELTNSIKRTNPDRYGFTTILGIKNIQLFQDASFVLGPVHFYLAGNNLSTSGLKDFLAFNQGLQNMQKPLTRQTKNQYIDLLPKIFTPDSTFIQTAVFDTALGDMQDNAQLSFAFNPNTPVTLLDLILSTHIQANLIVAVPLLDSFVTTYDQHLSQSTPHEEIAAPHEMPTSEKSLQTPATPLTARAQVDDWVQQGYITKHVNHYSTSIDFEYGILRINGKIVQSSQDHVILNNPLPAQK